MQEAAYPETFSHPNDNGVVPHPAGRVNGQEGLPSAGAITTSPPCLGTSVKKKGPYNLSLKSAHKTCSPLVSHAQTLLWHK